MPQLRAEFGEVMIEEDDDNDAEGECGCLKCQNAFWGYDSSSGSDY
jgi:hypothetical protein